MRIFVYNHRLYESLDIKKLTKPVKSLKQKIFDHGVTDMWLFQELKRTKMNYIVEVWKPTRYCWLLTRTQL